MVHLHFDDGLTTQARNESPMKRKQPEDHQHTSTNAGPENIFAFKKQKKKAKGDGKGMVNGIHTSQGSNGLGSQNNAATQNSALASAQVSSEKKSAASQTLAPVVNSTGMHHQTGASKKKRDHTEFSSDNVDSKQSSSSTADPTQPLSKRQLKEIFKREKCSAKPEQMKVARIAKGLPWEETRRGGDITSGASGGQKSKVDAATGTGNRKVADPELEFLRNKAKKRKKHKQELRLQRKEEERLANGPPEVKPNLFNGLHGTSIDRRKKDGSHEKHEQSGPHLTNGTAHHKAPSPKKYPSLNSVGGDTDVDTEPDGSPAPEEQDAPAAELPPPAIKPQSHLIPGPQLKPPQSRPSQAKPLQSKPQQQQQQQHQHQQQQQNRQQQPAKQHPKPSRGPKALLEHRKKLPIWSYQEDLRSALRTRDILVMLGETGSGKSTQLVQFLLNESWMRPDPQHTDSKGNVIQPCIAITQPRRIAATSLAYRVAQELGVQVGKEVGYSIRFDNKSDPYKTRIKFLTDGMLLREMLDDPELTRYRAVVVDEAHERTVSGDLVLGFLKGLVKKGGARSRGVVEGLKGKAKAGQHNLKVVVMSATVEVERLAEFFEEPVQDSSPSFESSGGASSTALVKASSSKRPESNVGICFVAGRQYSVETFYTPTPIEDYVDAALRTTFQIHFAEPYPGDILVFLPGQEDIESLERGIKEYRKYLDTTTVPDILPLQLYAGLPHNLQQLVFLPATTPRTRKVIIATNIAETSITVPGVRFVIDSGKEKARKYRHKIGLDSLLVSDISRSSAAQRKGRAGREAPGKCYRLYTEQAFYTLAENSTPEILRVDVASSILNIKARGNHDVVTFDYLDPPTREGLLKALETLYTLGALDNSGNITPLGHSMSKLPLDPQLSKVLISALEESNIDILPEVIDIIAALSAENLLLNIPHTLPDSEKTKVEEARRPMQRREGDHLYYLAIFRGFLKEKLDRRVWAQSRFYSHRALIGAIDVRKQLRNLCKSLCPPKFKDELYPPDHELEEHTPPEKAERILRCFLRGYFSNSARLVPDGTYRTVGDLSQTVAIHPQSVLFAGREEGGRRRFEAIMYHEWVFTSKPFARCVSAVQMDWVMEANPRYFMGGGGRG